MGVTSCSDMIVSRYIAQKRTEEISMEDRNGEVAAGRRDFIRAGLGLAGGIALPGLSGHAWAADQAPVGSWPAGVEVNSVFIGIAVPRIGTYAVQGEDELK